MKHLSGRIITVIGCLCALTLTTYAQVEVTRFQNIVESLSSGSAAYGAGFKGHYDVTGKVNGSPYESDTFQKTDFMFYRSTTYLAAEARYNILQHEFEVQTTGGIKPLAGNLVKGFHVIKSPGDTVRYVNAKDFRYEGTQLIGFLEEISGGAAKLYRMSQIEILKPTYNPSLEVGDRNINLKLRELHFTVMENELVQIKGKKEVIEVLKDKAVEEFMKREKINPKKTADLKLVFDFYNDNYLN